MAIHVVRLTSADVERFREVRLAGLRTDPNGFRFSESEDAAIDSSAWRERLDREFVVAALREGIDEIVGVGGFSRFAGEKLDHKGLIWGMYVRPPARGGGAADAILGSLIAHARTQVRLLQLTVMADNVRARGYRSPRISGQSGARLIPTRRCPLASGTVKKCAYRSLKWMRTACSAAMPP
jgi:RimJ/RimL family protein N-acetyltransferase